MSEPLSLIQTATLRVLHGAAKGLGKLDFDGIRKLGLTLGAVMWATLPGRKNIAVNAIHERLELPLPAARELARESFNHNARSFLEAVLIPSFGLSHPLCRVDNQELFNRIMTTQQPAIASTGHIGAWELEAGVMGEMHSASGRPCQVVVRRYGNRVFNQFMTELRSCRGTQVIGHREAVYHVLKGLRKNGISGFLVDHNASRDEALFMPFLGRTAAVNMGPALLAVRTGAEIWPSYLLREDDHYLLYLEPPLDTTALQGDRQDMVKAAAEFYTQAAERVVRRAPEQWFWMHNRWKTQEQ